MKITGMKTCYQRNPLGIDLADLTFSWQVEEAVGSAQKHARLVIAKDPDFRSVVFDSDRDDKERQGILPSGCYTPEVVCIRESHISGKSPWRMMRGIWGRARCRPSREDIRRDPGEAPGLHRPLPGRSTR